MSYHVLSNNKSIIMRQTRYMCLILLIIAFCSIILTVQIYIYIFVCNVTKARVEFEIGWMISRDTKRIRYVTKIKNRLLRNETHNTLLSFMMLFIFLFSYRHERMLCVYQAHHQKFQFYLLI